MPRPGGNPDFGTKHRFEYRYDEPLSAKPFNIRLPQSQMDRLMELPSEQRNKLVRGAIAVALDGEKGSEVTADDLVKDAIRDAITNKQAAITREKKLGKRQSKEAIAQWESDIERLEKYLEG